MNIGSMMASLGIDSELWQAEEEMREYERTAKKSLQKVQDKLNRVGDDFIAFGKKASMYLTAPILAAGAYMFKAASDMAESVNKVDVSFKQNAAEVSKWSKTTIDKFGIAQGSALDMAALFGDMSTSMGLTTAKAAEMSTQLVGLAGDLASFKNISIDQTQTALAGIFTGETESLKRLGIVMTEVNLQEYALAKGITKKYDAMNQAEKVLLRYDYILAKTKNSQGDFQRTAEGAANQTRTFGENIKETSANFGAIFMPAITSAFQWLNNLMRTIAGLDDITKKWIVGISLAAAAIGPLALLIGGIIKVAAMATVGVSALTTAFNFLRLAAMSSPWGMLATLVAAVAGYMYYFSGSTNTATASLKSLNVEMARFNGFTKGFKNIQAQIPNLDTMDAGSLQGLKAEIEAGITARKQAKKDVQTEYDNMLATDKSYLNAKAIASKAAKTDEERAEVFSAENIMHKRMQYFQNMKDMQELQNSQQLDALTGYLKEVEKRIQSTQPLNPKVTEAQAEFEKGLKGLNVVQGLFGNTTDAASNKLQVYNTYLEKLIDAGITSGKTIDYLKSRIDSLGVSMNRLPIKTGAASILENYKPSKAKGDLSGKATPDVKWVEADLKPWAGIYTSDGPADKATKMSTAMIIQANTTKELTQTLGDMTSKYNAAEIAAAKLAEPTKWQKFGDAISSVAINFQSLGDSIARAMEDGKMSFVEGANVIMQAALSMIGILSALAAAHIITAEASKGLVGIATAVAGLALLASLWATFVTPAKKQAQAGAMTMPTGLANGGIVPGGYPNDTFPAMLSTNEAVIPLSKLSQLKSKQSGQKVVFKIEGHTLVGILEDMDALNNSY